MKKIAKLFQNGGSQSVRLPAEYRFDGDEVIVEKVGNSLVLKPTQSSWDDFFDNPYKAPADFLTERDDDEPQSRDIF